MADLTFVLFDESSFSTLKSWFSDPELRRRFEHPTKTWFQYVTNEPNVYAWIIQQDGFPVGFLQLDVEKDRTGFFGFCVKPELRNKGYGKRILRALLKRPEAASLDCVVGTVEADNLASLSCLKAVGFIQEESQPDKDGFIKLIFTFKKNAGWLPVYSEYAPCTSSRTCCKPKRRGAILMYSWVV